MASSSSTWRMKPRVAVSGTLSGRTSASWADMASLVKVDGRDRLSDESSPDGIGRQSGTFLHRRTPTRTQVARPMFRTCAGAVTDSLHRASHFLAQRGVRRRNLDHLGGAMPHGRNGLGDVVG